MPDITDEDLDRIANDKQAQELLIKAARKRAEYWDALRDLEQYVGLEFDSGVPGLESLAVGVGRRPLYESDPQVEELKETLKEGFSDAAVTDETGIVFDIEAE